jgi:hypothetical protein
MMNWNSTLCSVLIKPIEGSTEKAQNKNSDDKIERKINGVKIHYNKIANKFSYCKKLQKHAIPL